MNRREFIVAFGALPALGVSRQLRFRTNPFTLGVASGDPTTSGVVLWTRLHDPVEPRIRVDWEMAEDDGFRRIARKGSSLALKELGHSVHAEVEGLRPGRTYWYRFMSGGELSPVGRTRTAPSGSPKQLRFAFASCQNYEHGYFTAHRHLANEEDLDFVVFLGDYIYERRFGQNAVRQVDAPESVTLEQYRSRYSIYRSDRDLQAAHAAFPWIVTTDDHEVANNYANAMIGTNNVSAEEFLRRRAAAFQAYYEFMPLRRASMPAGPNIRLFRRLSFGNLAQFHVLDTRQYRSDQPCGDGGKPRCAEALASSQTMMGAAQEKWLMDGLRSSKTRWNVLANQVMIAQLSQMVDGNPTFAMDRWDGYVESRRRLLNFFAEARPSNPVVITGDIHSNWASDLKLDFDNVSSPTVAAEFAGTSIASGGDGNDSTREDVLAANPHIKFYNARRGYVRVLLTPSLWRTDYRTLPFVSKPDAPIETRASFVCEDGRGGVQPA